MTTPKLPDGLIRKIQHFVNQYPHADDYMIAVQIYGLVEHYIEGRDKETVYNFADYLHKKGFIDADYYIEEPDPRIEFLAQLKPSKGKE